jgi:hypothetical protein
MNKIHKVLFTLIYITILTTSFNVYASTVSNLFLSLNPATKNCNYVDDKRYQPFSNIDKSFPGASTLGMTSIQTASGTVNCIDVSSSNANMINIVFTTLIAIVIILTVISISVSGIQYMTEEAIGSIKGKAKKRLQNSFIALGLALLSYSIVYTINKQLIEFEFNPSKIDENNTINKGIQDAIEAKAKGGVYVSDNAVEYLTQPIQQGGGYNQTPQGGVSNTFMGAYNTQTGPLTGPQTGVYAKVLTINNPTLAKASADGFLSLNGVNYNFRSGGGNYGYLPFGSYTVTMGDFSVTENGQSIRGRRETPLSMTVPSPGNSNGIFGYSFNLSDAYDSRVGRTRTELRIHPDGDPAGTWGCIGIKGDAQVQKQFFNSLTTLIRNNGGRYVIKVGM